MPLEELKKMNSKEVELDPNMNYKNIVRTIEIDTLPLIPCEEIHLSNTKFTKKNLKLLKKTRSCFTLTACLDEIKRVIGKILGVLK